MLSLSVLFLFHKFNKTVIDCQSQPISNRGKSIVEFSKLPVNLVTLQRKQEGIPAERSLFPIFDWLEGSIPGRSQSTTGKSVSDPELWMEAISLAYALNEYVDNNGDTAFMLVERESPFPL